MSDWADWNVKKIIKCYQMLKFILLIVTLKFHRETIKMLAYTSNKFMLLKTHEEDNVEGASKLKDIFHCNMSSCGVCTSHQLVL